MSKAPSVEKALTALQQAIRANAGVEGEYPVTSGEIPEDLQREGFRGVVLWGVEARRLNELRLLLPQDLRFEYMREAQIKDATWRFVCEAHHRGDPKLAQEFVATHGRTVEE